jgi:CubicO group peptidase (beta-lactamase class C family)
MKKTKIGWVAALLMVAAQASTAPKRSTAGLDDVLRTAVEQRRVPGVVAMVSTADAVAYQGAFGFDKDAIFAIASMTKPVTSVAVLQLVEAGKVKLDEPAATYLPELAAVQVLEGGALRAPKTQPTVRQLLTHTAGFGYEFLNKEIFDYAAQGKIPHMMTGGDSFMQAPLVLDPGTRWEYGINTDWLGKLVEKVSGQSLEDYLRQRVFEPLGMNDTSFNVPPEKRARLASVSHRKEDGALAAQPPPPAEPVKFFSGGGGLHSTAADYLKFIRTIMAGGQLGQRRILTAESVALMGRNQIGELSLRLMPSMMPQLAKDGAPMPGRPDKFGLGFAMNTNPLEKGRGANTLSWAGIFNTFFWIDRDKKVCAVVMTQMLPFLEDGPQALMNDFDRAVYAWRDASSR